MNIFYFMTGAQQDGWPLFIVGGIIGVLFMLTAFELAIIVITSLVGATLIVEPLHSGEPIYSIIFIGIVIGGVLIQHMGLGIDPPQEKGK